MRTHLRGALALVFLVAAPLGAQTGAPMSHAEYRALLDSISEPSSCDDADGRGTLALIRAEHRARAAESVREGHVVSLSAPLVPGPDANAITPLTLESRAVRADSLVTWRVEDIGMFPHGWAYPHLDALSHSIIAGASWRGCSLPESRERLDVSALRDGIIGRGVIVDLPRMRGVGHLPDGTAITIADLEEWERATGERIGEGDIVLLRVGRAQRAAADPAWRVTAGTAGPHPEIARWLAQRRVAALGSDVSNERYPSLVAGVAEPLHHLLLRGLGMPLLDNLALDELAAAAAARDRVTFLVIVAPLPIRGASGSMVNPLAVF